MVKTIIPNFATQKYAHSDSFRLENIDSKSGFGAKLRCYMKTRPERGKKNYSDKSHVLRFTPHVPISHDDKYFFCSAVSSSIVMPIDFNFNVAIQFSMSVGTLFSFIKQTLQLRQGALSQNSGDAA